MLEVMTCVLATCRIPAFSDCCAGAGERKRFYLHQSQECEQHWEPTERDPGHDGGTSV